jgi:glycosyltransferase involved in cell wall biosynthesis
MLHCDVLVIDNDPEGSAEPTVTSFQNAPVRYVLEPRPGIAVARNRALDESAESDLLVFIDDDEHPREAWLDSLVSTWRDGYPAAVMGRVVSVLAQPIDPWVAAGDFFERPRMPTGTSISSAATGNLLLDLNQIRAAGVRFSESMGMGAGEDVLFSRQLARMGGRLVWCDESVAEDFVPVERLTRRWLLSRAWSHGITTSHVELQLAHSAHARMRVRIDLLGGALARAAVGTARYLLGVASNSRRHKARGLRTAVRGLGMIAGMAGIDYEEYSRDGRRHKARRQGATPNSVPVIAATKGRGDRSN